jgi:hypothetical protein
MWVVCILTPFTQTADHPPKMDTPPAHFTILGERCTGTHFLQYAVVNNFPGIQYIKGEKHFFGNREFRENDSSPPENGSLHEIQMRQVDRIPPHELAVIMIVRDPVEWVDSFYKRKHHVPPEIRNSIHSFLNTEFYSIYEEPPKKGAEILEDRDWRTKERYRNLFALRAGKHAYMLEEVPKRFPHSILIKYEDLRDHYEETLSRIRDRFGWKPRYAEFAKITQYKGTFHAVYEKKPILLSREIQKSIWNSVDIAQETQLGYTPSEE